MLWTAKMDFILDSSAFFMLGTKPVFKIGSAPLIFGQKKALIFRSGLNKYGTYLLSRDESQYHRP